MPARQEDHRAAPARHADPHVRRQLSARAQCQLVRRRASLHGHPSHTGPGQPHLLQLCVMLVLIEQNVYPR